MIYILLFLAAGFLFWYFHAEIRLLEKKIESLKDDETAHAKKVKQLEDRLAFLESGIPEELLEPLREASTSQSSSFQSPSQTSQARPHVAQTPPNVLPSENSAPKLGSSSIEQNAVPQAASIQKPRAEVSEASDTYRETPLTRPRPQAQAPRARVPREPSWIEKAWKEIEPQIAANWTGIGGAIAVTMGVVFLAIYAALRLSEFGRFLVVDGFAIALLGGALFLQRKAFWKTLSLWVMSASGAVFLFGCLASVGIPTMQWVHGLWPSTGLMCLGFAYNLWIAHRSANQNFASLHVLLSLIALAVAPQVTLTLILGTFVAAAGLLFCYQMPRWNRHLLTTVIAFFAYHLYWFFTLKGAGTVFAPSEHWIAIACSLFVGLIAAGVHYRSVYASRGYDSLSLAAHLVNWGTLAIHLSLHSQGSKIVSPILFLAAIGLFLASQYAKTIEVRWLFLADQGVSLLIALIGAITLGRFGLDHFQIASAMMAVGALFLGVISQERDEKNLFRAGHLAFIGLFLLNSLAALAALMKGQTLWPEVAVLTAGFAVLFGVHLALKKVSDQKSYFFELRLTETKTLSTTFTALFAGIQLLWIFGFISTRSVLPLEFALAAVPLAAFLLVREWFKDEVLNLASLALIPFLAIIGASRFLKAEPYSVLSITIVAVFLIFSFATVLLRKFQRTNSRPNITGYLDHEPAVVSVTLALELFGLYAFVLWTAKTDLRMSLAALPIAALLALRAWFKNKTLDITTLVLGVLTASLGWGSFLSADPTTLASIIVAAIVFVASLAGFYFSKSAQTGTSIRAPGLVLAWMTGLLSAQHFGNVLSPLLPSAIWLIGALCAVEAAQGLHEKGKRSRGQLYERTDMLLASAAFLTLIAFAVRHYLVDLQVETRIGLVTLRSGIEVFGIAVFLYWLFKSPVTLFPRRIAKLQPYLLEASLLLGVTLISLETVMPAHPAIWMVAAFATFMLGLGSKQHARLMVYSLAFYFLALFETAFVSTTHATPSNHLSDQPWFLSLGAIFIGTAYVAVFHSKQWQNKMAGMELPQGVTGYARLNAMVQKAANSILIYPLAVSVALFLFWSFEKSVLSLFWMVECFVLFVLSLALCEEHFRKVSMVGVVAVLARMLIYDMVGQDFFNRALVFIAVGVLLIIMNTVYNRYKHRFEKPTGAKPGVAGGGHS